MLTSYSKIFLKKGREKSFQLRHHWIFSGAIEKSEGELIDGMPAHICNSKGQIIGLAHYGEKSIAARVLSFSPEQSEQDVIKRSLNKALKHRKSLQLPDSSNNTYRLVHSEGDLLPGLTVDIYKNTIVLQPHSNGMYRLRNEIADMLKELADTSCILLREGRARSADKLAARIIWGTDPTNIITENGIQFEVDLFKGQKTGFFIDQRINRKILGSCSENKSILNLFCYSGGFSLYALKSGASKVISVDSSTEALKLLDKNITLNFPNGLRNLRHQAIEADIKKYLPNENENFDIVILDPPALIKQKKDQKKGLSAYDFLNTHAIRRVLPGGLFFTFSCSQFLGQKELFGIASRAAKREGKTIQLMNSLNQAPCHRINPFHPESEYLKGLVLKVS